MAQTTAGLTFCAARVEVATDAACTPWTDISGYGASVAVSGGDRAFGTQHTFDGDTPIVKAGKRAERLVTVRYAYTEEADPAPFEKLRAQYETECGGGLCVRWFPKGKGAAANFKFETGNTFISKFSLPEGDAESTDIVMGEFEVPAASITKGTVGP